MVTVACQDKRSLVGVEVQLRAGRGRELRVSRSMKMVGFFALELIGGEGGAEVSKSCRPSKIPCIVEISVVEGKSERSDGIVYYLLQWKQVR